MKKTFVSILCAFLVSSACLPLFGADKVAPADEELSELSEDLKIAGKAAVKGIGSALNTAGDVLSKKTKSLSSKACVGTWKFTNAKSVTAFSCTDSGVFELTQEKGGTTRYWRGSYSSTSTSIDAHIITKGSKSLFFKSSEEVDLNWKISYKANNDADLRLSSDDLPDDQNGYDFSNLTLFVKD